MVLHSMEENLTIFVAGAMLLGLYYGYIVGKNVDQRFSKRKWVSKIMNGFFVIAFVLLAATNLEIFASAEESQFEFFIPGRYCRYWFCERRTSCFLDGKSFSDPGIPTR